MGKLKYVLSPHALFMRATSDQLLKLLYAGLIKARQSARWLILLRIIIIFDVCVESAFTVDIMCINKHKYMAGNSQCGLCAELLYHGMHAVNTYYVARDREWV